MATDPNKWNAKDYADNSTAQLSWANELISKLNLQGDESLLDIGCGDGKITASIAQKLTGGRVAGIDRSERMIEHAVSQFKLPNLSFHLMDATAVSLDDKFNIAFSNAVLHWVHDHKAVLINLKKHLTRNGKILFQMGGDGNATDIQAVIDDLISSAPWKKFFTEFVVPYRFCKVEDYEHWLVETGYKAQRIELIPKDMVHDNQDGLKGWLRTTWFPYTDQIPVNKKEKFLDNIIDQYLSNHPLDSEGKTHVGMVRLEVAAVVPPRTKNLSQN
ncbi:MAG: methyltransferase domain-containing protein [Bacteroidetes bacterium]|nr:methyltransferase domain-containing protein [Bacteroidota bacterium]